MRPSFAATSLLFATCALAQAPVSTSPQPPIVLRAAHLLDVAGGRLISPGEVLVAGERIVEAGTHVIHPAGAQIIDLGSATLMPGLIDVHVHLFLHPGNEGLQTVEESVPARTLLAAAAAKADLLAGFTAERDMGTEGAGCADVAVRNAIDRGDIPGPRLRVSCNAIDILGGHEDALGFNPDQHVLSNADYADSADELVHTMRAQRKGGADFTKIYETGPDRMITGADGQPSMAAPYQYSAAELAAAVAEAARTGSRVAVHATTEPGTGFAAQAGVASIDHAYVLSAATMQRMRERGIYAVPTFAIVDYFATHPEGHGNADPAALSARFRREQAIHIASFHRQMAAGVPFAVGSDVGPFPHGTQAREYVLMHEYGMAAADVLRAGLLHGASLLGWDGSLGELKAGFYADIIAVPGDPLADLHTLEHPAFVMKNGHLVVRDGAAQPDATGSR